MVGQKLYGGGGGEEGEVLADVGDVDAGMAGDFKMLSKGFVAYGEDLGTAGDDLADSGYGFFTEGGFGEKGDYGRAVGDEGYGAVLELTCGVGLAVDIGDLLELEGGFGSDAVIAAAADEKEVVGRHDAARTAGNLRGSGKDRFDGIGDACYKSTT